MIRRHKRRIDDIFKESTSRHSKPENDIGGSIWPVTDLNLRAKLIALKASPSVVALQSFIGKEELFICSGVIVESIREESIAEERFLNYIVTAASLLSSSSDVVALPPDIRVQVYLSDGKLYEGEVSALSVDFHYNIAVIKVISDVPLPTAVLKELDVCLPMVDKSQGNPKLPLARCEKQVKGVRPFNLKPGDKVVALGRIHHYSIFLIEVGEFSIESCTLGCQELFMTSCKSSRVLIGGPLINSNGEVIGLNFFHRGYTSFLPTNIVLKCLRSLKKHEHVHRPWHGIEAADLFTSDVGILEKVVQKFPDISGGVIAEKVKKDSPAERAGLLPMDVVIQCNRTSITCSLQFFEMMWDNAGESVELVVKRANGDCLNRTMIVQEAKQDRYNRWPVWELKRPPSNLSDIDYEITKVSSVLRRS